MEENIEIPLNEPDQVEETSEPEPEIFQENGAADGHDKNAELIEKIKEYETTVSHLRDELTKKTDVIIVLEKQKTSFEKEVTHVSCFACCHRSKTLFHHSSCEKIAKMLLSDMQLLRSKCWMQRTSETQLTKRTKNCREKLNF